MNNSNFKSSEELNMTDDAVFMAQISHRLQVEPFPVYQKKKPTLFNNVFILSALASVLVWFLWPAANELISSGLAHAESGLGVSLSILLGAIGLAALLLIEAGSDQVGEVI